MGEFLRSVKKRVLGPLLLTVLLYNDTPLSAFLRTRYVTSAFMTTLQAFGSFLVCPQESNPHPRSASSCSTPLRHLSSFLARKWANFLPRFSHYLFEFPSPPRPSTALKSFRSLSNPRDWIGPRSLQSYSEVLFPHPSFCGFHGHVSGFP